MRPLNGCTHQFGLASVDNFRFERLCFKRIIIFLLLLFLGLSEDLSKSLLLFSFHRNRLFLNCFNYSFLLSFFVPFLILCLTILDLLSTLLLLLFLSFVPFIVVVKVQSRLLLRRRNALLFHWWRSRKLILAWVAGFLHIFRLSFHFDALWYNICLR